MAKSLIDSNHVIFILSTVSMVFIVFASLLLIKHNTIIILLLIEVVFLASSINCIVGSLYFNDVSGQIFALVILTISAAELVIILSMVVLQYRIWEG